MPGSGLGAVAVVGRGCAWRSAARPSRRAAAPTAGSAPSLAAASPRPAADASAPAGCAPAECRALLRRPDPGSAGRHCSAAAAADCRRCCRAARALAGANAAVAASAIVKARIELEGSRHRARHQPKRRIVLAGSQGRSKLRLTRRIRRGKGDTPRSAASHCSQTTNRRAGHETRPNEIVGTAPAAEAKDRHQEDEPEEQACLSYSTRAPHS